MKGANILAMIKNDMPYWFGHVFTDLQRAARYMNHFSKDVTLYDTKDVTEK